MAKFSDFIPNKFVPHIYRSDWAALGYGCGATCISCITGDRPDKIVNSNKNDNSDWKDQFMVKYLNDRNFKVIPVSIYDVGNNITYLKNPVTKDHVIMISQMFLENVASWSIIYKDFIYHNFSISKLSTLEFFNSPILSSYVIFSKKWM